MSSIGVVILAGGLSRRMGTGQKAFAQLAGRPMILRVIERLYVSASRDDLTIAINANHEQTAFARLGFPVFSDRLTGGQGPLIGVWSGMEWLVQHHPDLEQMLVLPCDSPLFPLDIWSRLAQADTALLKVASAEGWLEPAHSLWPISLRGAVKKAVLEQQMHSFRDFLAVQPHLLIDWPVGSRQPFFNVNSPQDLLEAERCWYAESAARD